VQAHVSKEVYMKKILLVLAAVAAMLAVAAASPGAEIPVVGKALAVGTINTPMTLKVKPGAMIVERFTVAPGGDFGWHTHGSPVAVVVTGGTLTVFDPTIADCKPFKVSKGQSFIEPPNHLHLARNDGSKPARLYAMYIGVPKSGSPNLPGKQPTGCDA
jgi:quercetin dioxygenase-like cupin family protein